MAGCGTNPKRSEDAKETAFHTAEAAQTKEPSAKSFAGKYALFLKHQSDALEASIVRYCAAQYTTKGEASLAQMRSMLEMGQAKVWQENLAKAGLTLEELRTWAAANPKVVAEESALAEKRDAGRVPQGLEACVARIGALPSGDMEAAQREMEALYASFEPSPGPLDGIDLAVLPWFRDLEEGLKHASAEDTPIVLFFDASWCAPCKVTKKLFDDIAIAGAVEGKLTLIMLDVSNGTDEDEKVQARYGATSLPAMLMLSSQGEELARLQSVNPSVEELLGFLSATP